MPFDTPVQNLEKNPNEYSKKDFLEYINHGEWGLASDVLIHIVEENEPDKKPETEFWQPFLKAQNMMKAHDKIVFCKERGA